MGALGLDTSVIVRFLTGEPEPMALAARERISEALQEGHELVVADLAVAEAYYVLHKIYGIPKKAAVKALRNLFEQPGFRSEPGGVALEVLTEAGGSSSHKPGLVDRMLHAGYMRECERMLTFDKAAGKLDRVEVLG